ncbi:cytochrome c oxidase assembly protein [Pelomonas sp. P7]|uniref:Cytochrome c oxidase assembly protein CtaG n=1 Tax=Pelomonas caseinilytica TaxID=2906763 RepID=A0ABS8XGJ9_9BURK|nr:cytochrome c oxidase assembly protein [Pelomonas sp. P7]MCE4538375.1 cytochrome c oxidase assembly protein [Pelomonas sp. P7]
MGLRSIAAALRRDNDHLLLKLAVVVTLMFGFAYAMVPFYKAICNALGINVLSLAERQTALAEKGVANGNGQVDYSREITVEFDTNARGPWDFKPAVRHMTVHPGELAQVMYEFRNVQNRTMAAQAIPSYAPMQASAHFNKLECFCFNEYTLKPGESKQWPVVFVIDPKLPKDVKTITLSYTFFEVAGKGGVKLGQAPKSAGGSL